jgi:hypothetical protein
MGEQAQGNPGHETRDINVRVVAWCALGLVIAAVMIHLTTAGLFVLFKHEHPSPFAPSRITEPHPIAPEPRLQTNDRADLARVRGAEEAKLHSYGWVDKNAGVIRIPIERAMDLTAQRGLPVRTSPNEQMSGKTPLQMRQEKAAAIHP